MVVAEVLAGVRDLQQHRVCEGLAREGGTSGSKGDGDAVLRGNRQDLANLFFVVDFEDELGVEAIEGGVGAIGKCANGIGVLTRFRDEFCGEVTMGKGRRVRKWVGEREGGGTIATKPPHQCVCEWKLTCNILDKCGVSTIFDAATVYILE